MRLMNRADLTSTLIHLVEPSPIPVGPPCSLPPTTLAAEAGHA
jgi:hypothetical protein